MSSMEGVTVGTEVLYFDGRRNGNGSPYIVTKVGRKLIYAIPKSQYDGPHYYQAYAFRISTGIANDSYGNGCLTTYEQHEAAQLRARVVKEMGELGLELARYRPTVTDSITTKALIKIVRILKEVPR